MKYKIQRHPSFRDFALVKLPGATYICPGWIRVAEGTSREDIEFESDIIIEKRQVSSDVISESPVKHEFHVASSNGRSEYMVTSMNGIWNCDCPASTYRRGHCKHIKTIIESSCL